MSAYGRWSLARGVREQRFDCTEIERCFLASFRMLGPVYHIIFLTFPVPSSDT